MKTAIVAVVCAVVSALAVRGDVTPDELIRAVDQMSPTQAYELLTKLESRLWKPIPQGFFTRLAFDVAMSVADPETIDPGSVLLSGGELDLDPVGGFDAGILWRTGSRRFRLGLRFGGWTARDSNLGDGGYSRAEFSAGGVALAANAQWIRTGSWLVWTEVAPGWGFVTLEALDTPAGGGSTLREFDASFAQIDLQAGVSYRFNPLLSLFVSGGYRVAESADLEEGGRTSDVKVDASGLVLRCGLGVNF